MVKVGNELERSTRNLGECFGFKPKLSKSVIFSLIVIVMVTKNECMNQENVLNVSYQSNEKVSF